MNCWTFPLGVVCSSIVARDEAERRPKHCAQLGGGVAPHVQATAARGTLRSEGCQHQAAAGRNRAARSTSRYCVRSATSTRKWNTARSCHRSYRRGGCHAVTSAAIICTGAPAAPSRAFAASSAAGATSSTVMSLKPAANKWSTSVDAPPPTSRSAASGRQPRALNQRERALRDRLVPRDVRGRLCLIDGLPVFLAGPKSYVPHVYTTTQPPEGRRAGRSLAPNS